MSDLQSKENTHSDCRCWSWELFLGNGWAPVVLSQTQEVGQVVLPLR